jgi:hypothetical protein
LLSFRRFRFNFSDGAFGLAIGWRSCQRRVCSSSFHGRQRDNPHVESTLFFPRAVGPYRPLPTSHDNGVGNQTHENNVSDLMHGLGDDVVAIRAFCRHVNPEAIDEVIHLSS